MSGIYKYNTTIDIPFGKLAEMIEWCSGHCENDWRFAVLADASRYEAGTYIFLFESEKDYFTFLVWKQ